MTQKQTIVGVAAYVAAALFASACGAAATEPAESPVQSRASSVGGEDEMMVIRVVVNVKPERVDDFVQQIQSDAPRVRALHGCERYELFRAADEPKRFFLYEEWTSREAFEEYQQSALLRESFAVLGPMMEGPPDSAYFAVSQQTN